jgi:hypothetical protein
MKKHHISQYMTLSPAGNITFGWRCRCGVASRRFKTASARVADILAYKGNHKALRAK